MMSDVDKLYDDITTNFFWTGENFQFLNRLTILSHLVVGHKAVVWLSGTSPNSIYWIDDIEEIDIRSADEVINVEKFIRSGGNVRTVSDLFSFTFLYEYGGLYCDTDMIALKKFPDDEWILATYTDNLIRNEFNTLGIGIIKAPKSHAVFKRCIDNIERGWGNVKVFSKFCAKYKLEKTHPNEMFYPWGCKSGPNLL